MRSSTSLFAVLLVMGPWQHKNAHGFAFPSSSTPRQPIPSLSTIVGQCHHYSSSQIHQVAFPLEELEKAKEKEEKDGADDVEMMEKAWTPVEGGFLPNFGPQVKRILQQEKRKNSIAEAASLQEYKEVVVDAEEDIVVVMFYAPWCRACKAVAPHYRKLAQRLGGLGVKFVRVPVTHDNAVLHQGLGIPSVPFGHIYHKEAGLVEELKLKKKEFDYFKQVLETYVEGECEIPPDEGELDSVFG